MSNNNVSVYFNTLQGAIRMRYEHKIKCIKHIDPYTLCENGEYFIDNQNLPKITYMDIVAYFLSSHSFFTAETLKAYKSLESYEYVKAGFVREVLSYKIRNNFVVTGKVKHSQRMNEPPTKPWLILNTDGSIKTAHCDCMAGLGEACSHTAAVAFYLVVKFNEEEVPCTSRLSKWNIPAAPRNAGPIRIRDLDLGSIKAVQYNDAVAIDVPPLEGSRWDDYLRELEEADPEAVILSVTHPYAAKRATTLSKNLPKLLTDFFDPECDKNIDELRNVDLDFSITPEQQKAVAELTVKQSESQDWYKYRAGRITASKFKSVCSTSLEKPSISLVKLICNPTKVVFYKAAISYGSKNEKIARRHYENLMKQEHRNFKISDVGFVISLDTPQFGASADGLISCQCCGSGCVEIKCPYRAANEKITLLDFVEMKDCFLIKKDDSYSLCKNHQYYYQVQLQLYVLKRQFCDFVVWSKQFCFIERICLDENFLTKNVEKALRFHNDIIKPELISHYYTEPQEEDAICYCNRTRDAELIKCSNKLCDIKLFHVPCVDTLNIINGIIGFVKHVQK